MQASDRLRVVAAETAVSDALDAVSELNPSLFLIDKAFGIQAAMNVLKHVREKRLQSSVVVWGASLSGTEALRILQAGALGVMRKSASLPIIMNCLTTVLSGSTWMEDDMLGDMERPIRSGRFPLTARELQVMELVERGMKNKDIGTELGIRTGTVKIHLKHIFEKTGIRGRYGLALSGLKEKGFLSMPVAEAV
jgi:DNA-binding NarL/FixJ family response regulator